MAVLFLFLSLFLAVWILCYAAIKFFAIMKAKALLMIPDAELQAYVECTRNFIRDCSYGPALESMLNFNVLSLEFFVMPLVAVLYALFWARHFKRRRPVLPLLVCLFAATPLLAQWLFSSTASLPWDFLTDQWHSGGMQKIRDECLNLSIKTSCQSYGEWQRQVTQGAAILRYVDDVLIFLYSMVIAVILTASSRVVKL